MVEHKQLASMTSGLPVERTVDLLVTAGVKEINQK